MNKAFIDSKEFNGIDFTKNGLTLADYEACNFINCNFSECDLSDIGFVECNFDNCNFSLVKLYNTTLREVCFNSSKLLGLRFDNCSKYFFEIRFEESILNLSSFYRLDMTRIKFTGCKLHEVDFTESDMKGIQFNHCDLDRAIFDRTKAEKTDFRTAYNYSIDLDKNHFTNAKFSLNGIKGLLSKYKIEIE